MQKDAFAMAPTWWGRACSTIFKAALSSRFLRIKSRSNRSLSSSVLLIVTVGTVLDRSEVCDEYEKMH